MPHRPLRAALATLFVLTSLLSLAACSDEPKDDGPQNNAVNNDAPNNDAPDADDPNNDAPDADEPDADEPDVTEDEPEDDGGNNDRPPGSLCAPCVADDECGGADDRCLNLPFEGGRCTTDCSTDDGVCPEGFQCATVQELPLVRQCVPDGLLCDDLCALGGVECPQGEVCDPLTGQCGAPLGLCDLDCVDNDTCGGPDDQCVFLGGSGETICAQDCAEDQESCPEGFFCGQIGTDTGIFQCVPDALTCVERCEGVACGTGEICDPFTGQCARRLGLCDTGCTNNALCGGPDDICIAPGNPDGESFCATACRLDQVASDCPLNYFCAQLNGRELGVCVPLDITCVDDRCDGVECPEGSNCDVRSGQCVRREIELCDPCGDLESISCGGPDDLCLNLGDPGGVVCTQDCSADGECPNEGYACVILSNTTRRACIPIGGDCRRCDGVECDPGDTCNPLTGLCEGPPTSCLEVPCLQGQVCNPDSEACEEINAPCNFDTRVADCFGPVRKCSATRAGADGVCALICDSNADCSPEAPNCLDLYRVGELCVPDGLGGPSTCGVTAPEGVGIGRPCGRGVATPCPGDAPLCIQGVEQEVDGFCSAICDTDADCEGHGSCQAVRGRQGRFCVPDNCLCLTGAEVPGGVEDLLAEVLTPFRVGRCGAVIEPTEQRNLDPATPGSPLKPEGLGGLVSQPLSAPGFARSLQGELTAAVTGPRPVRDAIVAAAARQGILIEAREASFALPDQFSPLVEGVRAFVQATGDDFDPGMIQGDPGTIPGEAQAALGQILAAAAEVVTARAGAADALGLSPADLDVLFAQTPYLFLPPAREATVPDLADPQVLARLTDLDLRPLYQAAADLASTVEAAGLNSADLAGLELRVETSAGMIVLGGAGDTIWTDALVGGDAALLLDVSGNDTYRVAAGANARAGQPVALVIDLEGADQYTYEAVADPRDNDAWLPSDAGGRFAPTLPVQAGNGPVSLSDTARQGAGRLGVGMLFDLGGEADRYTSLRMSQGAGVLGVGALFDDGGADQYAVEAFGQGAGLLGLGLLIDGGPNATADTWRAWHGAQGFGAARGVGALIDVDDDSRYTAEAATGLTDVLYFSQPDRGQSNRNLAQGAGAGVLPADQRNPDRQALGGGLGVLFDAHGADTYTAGTFAQGIGQHLGIGLLIDGDGDDARDARFGAQGYGELVALGLLLDDEGNDTYDLAPGRHIGSLLGHGAELGAGFFMDASGDDQYQAFSLSAGVGLLNGAGFFMDLGGTDQHTAVANNTWGFASTGLTDPQPDEPRLQVNTYGLFIDAGPGQDAYTRPDLEEQNPVLIGNDRSWTQRAQETSDAERGGGIDGDGQTGLE